MALAGVGLRNAQTGDGPPAQGGDGVDGIPAGDAGEPPGGVRAQIARTLDGDDDLGAQDTAGGQERVVNADGLQIAAPGLPRRDGPGDPTGPAQGGDRARIGQGQGAAVGHDVDDARRPPPTGPRAGAGDDRRKAGVQVGDHDRRPVQHEPADRPRQDVVMRRALLVGAGDHDLIGHVTGLDQVTVGGRIGRQDVETGRHHGVTAGAQAPIEGRDLQAHPFAGPRLPAQLLIGHGAADAPRHQPARPIGRRGDLNIQLQAPAPGLPPGPPQGQDLAIAPHHDPSLRAAPPAARASPHRGVYKGHTLRAAPPATRTASGSRRVTGAAIRRTTGAPLTRPRRQTRAGAVSKQGNTAGVRPGGVHEALADASRRREKVAPAYF